MTVDELRVILNSMEDTDLVCIDTNGFHRGVFPVDDDVKRTDLKIASSVNTVETYHCVVLYPSNWPTLT
jgi:hypothetical protein